ncbi:hypothetical protein U8335_25655 [Roseiconus lacunae]|uniref:hypothetical protein n=1 Tax=Roseiconus lacunae TaxID=2605694 RepID=UPI0030883A99|nr:hypothetical protein U8335_25655 [Stieleria sp. HD01]
MSAWTIAVSRNAMSYLKYCDECSAIGDQHRLLNDTHGKRFSPEKLNLDVRSRRSISQSSEMDKARSLPAPFSETAGRFFGDVPTELWLRGIKDERIHVAINGAEPFLVALQGVNLVPLSDPIQRLRRIHCSFLDGRHVCF